MGVLGGRSPPNIPYLVPLAREFPKIIWPCAELNFRAQYGWSSPLKILAVSDVVVDRLYSAQIAEHFRDVDMILGCGDLPYEYLEFLVSALNVPLLYVPGNHDPQYDGKKPAARADGCDLLDQRVAWVKGLNLAGLGGSIRYKPVSPNQYTQTEMYLRVISFLPRLLRHAVGLSLDRKRARCRSGSAASGGRLAEG